jgi:hypothetical protein
MVSASMKSILKRFPHSCIIWGDVIYSFGGSEYYYDQFYDTYRSYPAPIFAIAGNHDGMVGPKSTATRLQPFLENLCQAGKPPHRTPETGELLQTVQIRPGLYFTLEAPFARIKKQKFAGAVSIAVHHPPYVAVNPNNKKAGNHSSSRLVLKDINAACAATEFGRA